MVDIAPRYMMSIENKGRRPSLQVFYKLVTLFNIPVDQFFFSNTRTKKRTRRRQIEKHLDGLDEKDLIIIEATAKGIS